MRIESRVKREPTSTEVGSISDTEITGLVVDLDREAASTIWYALEEYRVRLQSDLQAVIANKDSEAVEDIMFLATGLGRVAAVQFSLRDDYPMGLSNKVQKWLGL
jgi:hypothetical protein